MGSERCEWVGGWGVRDVGGWAGSERCEGGRGVRDVWGGRGVRDVSGWVGSERCGWVGGE